MRRKAVLSSVVVACVVALLLAACGGSGEPAAAQERTGTSATARAHTRPRATPPTPAEIQRAAQLTAAKPGYSADLNAYIALPQFDGEDIIATGPGQFNAASDSGTLDLAVTLPGLLSLAGPVQTHVVIVGSNVYVQTPSALKAMVGGVKPWLGTTLAAVGLGETLGPAEVFREVARDATTAVKDQNAQVTLNPTTGLVSSFTVTYSEPSGTNVTATLNFTGYGPQPAASAPPASEVSSLTAALSALGI